MIQLRAFSGTWDEVQEAFNGWMRQRFEEIEVVGVNYHIVPEASAPKTLTVLYDVYPHSRTVQIPTILPHTRRRN